MAKYILILCGFVGVTLAAAYFTYTHEDRQEASRLRAEHARLRAQNERLMERNEHLREQVVALRDDPRLAERRARALGNLARKNELIFSFERPSDQVRVAVHLSASPDAIMLAGKAVSLPQLSAQLEQLHARVPLAQLHVKLSEELDPLTRQQLVDALSRSPVQLATPLAQAPTTPTTPSPERHEEPAGLTGQAR